MAEIHQARSDVQMWESSTKHQYDQVQQISEAHQYLCEKQQRLIEENVMLVNQNRHQQAEFPYLWQQEEHASEVVRKAASHN